MKSTPSWRPRAGASRPMTTKGIRPFACSAVHGYFFPSVGGKMILGKIMAGIFAMTVCSQSAHAQAAPQRSYIVCTIHEVTGTPDRKQAFVIDDKMKSVDGVQAAPLALSRPRKSFGKMRASKPRSTGWPGSSQFTRLPAATFSVPDHASVPTGRNFDPGCVRYESHRQAATGGVGFTGVRPCSRLPWGANPRPLQQQDPPRPQNRFQRSRH